MNSEFENTDICSKLEQWGQDDLNLLKEFGPSSFTTAQLFQMKVALMDKYVMAERKYKFLTLSLLTAFGWAAFGTALMVVGLNILAYIVFGLFSVCTILSVVGMLLVSRSDKSSNALAHYIDLIQSELFMRRQVTSAQGA